MQEARITKQIIDWLNQQSGCRAVKIHQGQYSGGGEPDIFATYEGHTIVIEVKRPGKNPRRLQTWKLEEWARAGATAIVATTLHDVEATLACN